MKSIEQHVSIHIPHVKQLSGYELGFVANGGHVTGLGLYKKGLVTLPDIITQLPSLQELYLGYNFYSSFPESILQMSELKVLDLQHNQLPDLPKEIYKLKSLKTLVLISNQLTSFPEILTRMTWLESLYLDENNLQSLPESLGYLNLLNQLSLRNTGIRSLPESIKKLVQLKKLILSLNSFEGFPEVLGNLATLKELDLSNTKLSKLPESVGNLSSLEVLLLSNNELSSIPEIIGKLKSLLFIDLANNKLTSLPETIGELRRLQWLGLMNNMISTLPTVIGNLASLRSLNISHNKLVLLPETIGGLRWLAQLNLDDNKLTSLPASIGMLASLVSLSLASNQITSLPESLEDLNTLNFLNLKGNKISSIPEGISYMHSLRIFNIENNPISSPPSMLKQQINDLKKEGIEVKYSPSLHESSENLAMIHSGENGSCNHIHGVKLVADNPNGSKKILYQGKMDFSSPQNMVQTIANLIQANQGIPNVNNIGTMQIASGNVAKISTPVEEMQIARQAFEAGDLIKATHHVCIAISSNPFNPEYLALFDRIINSILNPHDLIPFTPGRIFIEDAAGKAYIHLKQEEFRNGLEILFNIARIKPETPYFVWTIPYLSNPKFFAGVRAETLLTWLIPLQMLPPTGSKGEDLALLWNYVAQIIDAFMEKAGKNTYLQWIDTIALRNSRQYNRALNMALDAFSETREMKFALSIAKTYREEGNFEEALKYYSKCIEMEPNNMDLYIDTGDLLINMNQLQRSLEFYEMALKFQPTHDWALPSAIFLRFILTKNIRFFEELKAYASMNPNNARAKTLLILTITRKVGM